MRVSVTAKNTAAAAPKTRYAIVGKRGVKMRFDEFMDALKAASPSMHSYLSKVKMYMSDTGAGNASEKDLIIFQLRPLLSGEWRARVGFEDDNDETLHFTASEQNEDMTKLAKGFVRAVANEKKLALKPINAKLERLTKIVEGINSL